MRVEARRPSAPTISTAAPPLRRQRRERATTFLEHRIDLAVVGEEPVNYCRQLWMLLLDARKDRRVFDGVVPVQRVAIALPLRRVARPTFDMSPRGEPPERAGELRMSRRNPWCDDMNAVAIEAVPSSLSRFGGVAVGMVPATLALRPARVDTAVRVADQHALRGRDEQSGIDHAGDRSQLGVEGAGGRGVDQRRRGATSTTRFPLSLTNEPTPAAPARSVGRAPISLRRRMQGPAPSA